MPAFATPDAEARARQVRLALFDIDGVLTDGRLYFGADGEALKVFHTLDGHGLKLLARAGVATGVISGRACAAAVTRVRELRLAHALFGVEDKLARFESLCAELKLEPQHCAFMGDDLPDLPVMRRCGLAVAVPNAVADVRACAHVVTSASGGNGAVREFCEFLLRAHGTLDPAKADTRT